YVLAAIDGLLPVVIRNVVPELIHHHVQDSLGLPEAVLHRGAPRMQRACGNARNEQRGSQRDLGHPLLSCPHCFLPIFRANTASTVYSRALGVSSSTLIRTRNPARGLTAEPRSCY